MRGRDALLGKSHEETQEVRCWGEAITLLTVDRVKEELTQVNEECTVRNVEHLVVSVVERHLTAALSHHFRDQVRHHHGVVPQLLEELLPECGVLLLIQRLHLVNAV